MKGLARTEEAENCKLGIRQLDNYRKRKTLVSGTDEGGNNWQRSLFSSLLIWECFQSRQIGSSKVSQMGDFESKMVCGMRRRGRVSRRVFILGRLGRTLRTHSLDSMSAPDYPTLPCV